MDWRKLFQNSDFVLAIGIVAILGVMIVPLPPIIIDVLLVFSIALSVVLLLTGVYVSRALDFSIFPSILLIATLFRLALNVATTRVILLHGGDGAASAGNVIKSFGEFVVGGNYAVGMVVFTILVIINFIVITKGAGRVAEVSARFTLDAMPGKQMAIDADLNAGIINEEEARRRRSEISREADFYGAMDGASKFVRGDAIAGILIVVVNMIGGILIGVLQKDMAVGDAMQVFALLTIGDGLVTQVPALLISTAAGIIVTRTASAGKGLGDEFSKQLLMQPKAIAAASGIMGVMGLVPGLPTFPFLLMAGGLGLIYRNQIQKQKNEEDDKLKKENEEKLKPKPPKLENLLPVDLLELEVGYGLISIVDAEQNGDLLERISNIRKQFALDLGVIIPALRIRDNLELKPGDYQVLMKGIPAANGNLMVGHLLAMDPGGVSDSISGIPTKEPAFGLDALWITPQQKEEATLNGYTVVDLSTVIATHLTEVIRQNAHELLGRQELQILLDSFKETHPKVLEDLIPNVVTVTTLLKILKNLLKEGVPVRDFRTILEAVAEQAPINKDPAILTEHVRTALARVITKKLASTENELTLLTLDRKIEETIASGIIQTDQGAQLSVDPEFVRTFISELNDKAVEMAREANQTVVLCSPLIRSHLKGLVDRFIPNVTVLSHNEITPNVRVKSYGTVRLAYAN